MAKTIMVDIDNTIADYTNGLRDYIRECGRGEDECPCPEPTAYDFTLTGGWPFSGDPKAFTWWHTRAVADGLYSREEPYEGAVGALNQLHDAGWNIIMATSRADDWRGESQRWLHRNGFQFDWLLQRRQDAAHAGRAHRRQARHIGGDDCEGRDRTASRSCVLHGRAGPHVPPVGRGAANPGRTGMNEENPSTDATFDRLLDELHGIQSGQSYAAALEWTSRLRAGLDALESLAVRDAVLNAHLSKTEIASALGITRQTLYNRHKELFGELKEQCRRKPRHPIDSTAYRIRDGRTIPAKEKE